jgi:phospholipase/carboxylesterase
MVPLSQTSPVDLAGARILISAGEFDPIAQPGITKALAELFRHAGADVTLKFQPIGHELTPRDVALAHQWLGL